MDTIDLLEAIGQDASLRYAPGEALLQDQRLGEAPAALASAILAQDRRALDALLGTQPGHAVQSTQSPGREDEDEEQDEDEGDPQSPRKSASGDLAPPRRT